MNCEFCEKPIDNPTAGRTYCDAACRHAARSARLRALRAARAAEREGRAEDNQAAAAVVAELEWLRAENVALKAENQELRADAPARREKRKLHAEQGWTPASGPGSLSAILNRAAPTSSPSPAEIRYTPPPPDRSVGQRMADPLAFMYAKSEEQPK